MNFNYIKHLLEKMEIEIMTKNHGASNLTLSTSFAFGLFLTCFLLNSIIDYASSGFFTNFLISCSSNLHITVLNFLRRALSVFPLNSYIFAIFDHKYFSSSATFKSSSASSFYHLLLTMLGSRMLQNLSLT